jgi:hypothetical protein
MTSRGGDEEEDERLYASLIHFFPKTIKTRGAIVVVAAADASTLADQRSVQSCSYLRARASAMVLSYRLAPKKSDVFCYPKSIDTKTYA